MKLREHPEIKIWPLGAGSSYANESTFQTQEEQLVLKNVEIVPRQGSQPDRLRVHFETGEFAIMPLDGPELKDLRTNLCETLNRQTSPNIPLPDRNYPPHTRPVSAGKGNEIP